MSKKKQEYNPLITYDEQLKRWNMPSNTHMGHNYAVRVDPCGDGLTCTCVWARGMMKRTGKPCIHIIKVKEWLDKLPKDVQEVYMR